jgi:hypothetical protein
MASAPTDMPLPETRRLSIPLPRPLWIGLATAVLLVGLWIYTSATWIIWDGDFQLTVRVSSTAGPLESVTCQAFSDRSKAELYERYPSEKTDLWSTISLPFDGEPLQVTVRVSGRESMSGRELSRYQCKCLTVVGMLQDGQSLRKFVEIPDGRISREVTVSLP